MVTLDDIRQDVGKTVSRRGSDLLPGKSQYVCLRSLNLYQSPTCEGLVTQAAAGRYLKFADIPENDSVPALRVQICEDDYEGWLAIADLSHLTIAARPYRAPELNRAMVQQRLPQAIAYSQTAMAQPNQYRWGGTVPPHFDCSGLMQAAFASAGVCLPRDSYQQEAFTQTIGLNELQPGDLIFFGTPKKTTHVALYLSAGKYIHSSGKDQGRNGIGIDSIWDLSDPISHTYHQQIRCAGRVDRSYQPGDLARLVQSRHWH